MTWQATADVVVDPGPSTPNRYLYSRYIDDQIAMSIEPSRRGVPATLAAAPRVFASLWSTPLTPRRAAMW
jgi:hypothetical protein